MRSIVLRRVLHRHQDGALLTVTACIFVSLAASAATEFGASPKRMPPAGLPVPAEVRSELEKATAELGKEIEQLQSSLTTKPQLLDFLPDVQIFYNAVRYALDDDIFYRTNDFGIARKLLAEGRERAAALRSGKTPWNEATGLVVRGYRSQLDGSVQPYGLVVPPTYKPGTGHHHRLDLWLHGRNEKLSELAFVSERESSRGEFTPDDTFVLHPYGRYCNAFKFAGEVDVFEALAHAREHYPIDENRVLVRGFSMGGGATWHLATHYAGLWAAAAPGAGFVDTAIFQKVSQWQTPPPWYVQKLWRLYDSKEYAANLFNCPTIAYSGEIDGQRQAAELMTKAMAEEGMTLVHIIGPNTGHKYEPKAKEEVARRVDALAAEGRNPVPKKIRFTTFTLRYNHMDWITVDALEHHWERARIEAEIVSPDKVSVTTTNVSALTLSMPSAGCPLATAGGVKVVLDSQTLSAPGHESGTTWTVHFTKTNGRWKSVHSIAPDGLAKRHGLQGPIDDAFMESFLMVRPTGTPLNPGTGAWLNGALTRAATEWRLQFRGEPRLLDDTQVTDADIAGHNLVLWGDPKSNRLLGRIARKLPLAWDAKEVRCAGKSFSTSDHIPMLIFPNPLNPKHYVVVNSGFTFADAAPTSNALQIPELPDYAVLNLASQTIVHAGFFDEHWK